VKVVLREDVENLGRKGDLIEVRDGYARNFLVPRGLALKATKGIVKQSDSMRRGREAREARDRSAAEEIAAKLSGARVQLQARAGEGGRLFGSITASDVADAVIAQTGIEIDRRKLELDEPLKELGPAEIELRLHPEVTAKVQVEVVAG
jgi:large subunit ribosomal protein L9